MKKALFFALIFPVLTAVQVEQEGFWYTDLEQAQETAKAQNKKIILVFQGSDWCTPCMKLDREIWQSPVFRDYARKHFVMVKVDFPRKKKNRLPKAQAEKNNRLAEQYNPHGIFPLVVVMTPDGKVIRELTYEHVSPQVYIRKIEGN